VFARPGAALPLGAGTLKIAYPTSRLNSFSNITGRGVQMAEVVVAQKNPYAIDVKAGERYAWCTCGRSAKQPLCDGTHKEFGFSPLPHVPEEDGTIHMCGCKHTKNPPFCDGSHKDL
jgi:CDGSH-type Zn-finger protein